MSRLAQFLREAFGDDSLTQMSKRTGIDWARLGRIMRGEVLPSPENVLRIAAVSGTHPARICDLAGMSELAEVCRRIGWTDQEAESSPSGEEAKLMRRVKRLLDLGFDKRLEAALAPIEGSYEILEPSFQRLTRQSGAEAAVLAAGSSFLLFDRCREKTAAALAELGDSSPWRRFRSDPLSLYLRNNDPKALTAAEIQTELDVWSAGLSALR